MHNRPAPHLATEILEQIFIYLTDDYSTLLACALVSRTWLPPARRLAFQNGYTLYPDPTTPDQGVRHQALFFSTSTIAPYVTKLCIMERVHPWRRKGGGVRSRASVTCFTNRVLTSGLTTAHDFLRDLRSLELCDLEWPSVASGARVKIRPVMANVTVLNLSNVDFTTHTELLEILSAAHSLEVLEVYNLWIERMDIWRHEFAKLFGIELVAEEEVDDAENRHWYSKLPFSLPSFSWLTQTSLGTSQHKHQVPSSLRKICLAAPREHTHKHRYAPLLGWVSASPRLCEVELDLRDDSAPEVVPVLRTIADRLEYLRCPTTEAWMQALELGQYPALRKLRLWVAQPQLPWPKIVNSLKTLKLDPLKSNLAEQGLKTDTSLVLDLPYSVKWDREAMIRSDLQSLRTIFTSEFSETFDRIKLTFVLAIPNHGYGDIEKAQQFWRGIIFDIFMFLWFQDRLDVLNATYRLTCDVLLNGNDFVTVPFPTMYKTL